MRGLVYCLANVAFLLLSGAAADTVYDFVRRGELDRARQALSDRVTAAVRDGNTLYFQSLLETDAARAAALLEAALPLEPNRLYLEDIYRRLAQYYYFTGQIERLSDVIVDYTARFEPGRHALEMRRLAIAADERAGRFQAALRQADRLSTEVSREADRQWVTVDRGRILAAFGKNIGAMKMLRRLSRAKSGEGVPQALYLLAMHAARGGKVDDAVFYYNVLREAYPAAVGLDALIDSLGTLDVRSNDDSAERVTGTFYSVKVGVFSKRGNARRQAEIFRAYDRPVDIKRRTISGKRYYVVYVGRFTDWDEAVAFKTQLEATHGDVYQVVAR